MNSPQHADPGIYGIIKDEILTLKLPPGSSLPENETACRFGVSRTPVRSVFERLRSERFIDIYPRKGTYVTYLDLDTVEQILYLRTCIECDMLTSLAANPGKLLLDKLQANLAQQRVQAANKAAPELFFLTDSHFHEIYYREAGKGKLWDLILTLQVHYTRYRILLLQHLGNYDELVLQHQELYQMIRDGREKEIAGCITRHLTGSLEVVKGHGADGLRQYFMP